MNVVADESVDQRIVDQLRQAGHDVVYVSDRSPSIADDEVLQQANDRTAILLTADKDFGEIVFRQGRVHGGVVLIRLFGLSPDEKAVIGHRSVSRPFAGATGFFFGYFSGLVRIRRKL
jgi:predicted nuclease of predicted toxin-antitoxin system